MAENVRNGNLLTETSSPVVRGEGQLIIELACGASAAQAAQKAHISERTVYRRLADDQFTMKVYKARELMIGQACGKLSMACAKAADTLDQLLDDDNPRIRLQAAQAILNSTISLSDNWAVDVRLSRLEQMMTPISNKRKEREQRRLERENGGR